MSRDRVAFTVFKKARSPYFQIEWRIPREGNRPLRITRSSHTTTRSTAYARAVRQADKYEREGLSPTYGERLVFRDFATEEMIRDWDIKESTEQDYLNRFRLDIIPFFGGIRLAHIKRQDLRRFDRYLAGPSDVRDIGMALSTRGRTFQVLRNIFREAMDADPPILTSDPSSGFSPKKTQNERRADPASLKAAVSAWNEVQSEQYIRKALEMYPPPEPYGTAMVVMLCGGPRLGEVLGLLWSDWSGGELSIKRSMWKSEKMSSPKSAAGVRQIYPPLLRPAGVRALNAWKMACTDTRPDSRIFDIGYYDLGKRHRSIVEAAELTYIPVKGLRTTFGSILGNRLGWKNIKLVSRMMGHEVIETTLKFYVKHVRMNDEVDEAALEGFGG